MGWRIFKASGVWHAQRRRPGRERANDLVHSLCHCVRRFPAQQLRFCVICFFFSAIGLQLCCAVAQLLNERCNGGIGGGGWPGRADESAGVLGWRG